MAQQSGSVVGAAIWMIVLSILLFWIPGIGPLIAGFVGGRKAGTLANAILAAILPALITGAFFFFFGSVLTGMPLFGLLAGAGTTVLALTHVGPLLLGAIIGALLT